MLACTGAQIVLAGVQQRGGHVLLSGAAVTSLSGRPLTAKLLSDGAVVADGRIPADGLFALTAPLPPAGIRDSNHARYEVFVGPDHSEALKLTRRSMLLSATLSGRDVLLRGRVSGAFRAGTPVSIRLRISCETYRQIATVTLSKTGTFSARVPAPPHGQQQIAAYRAQTMVLVQGHPQPTDTLLLEPS